MTTTEQPRALVDLHGRSPWSVLPPLCLGFFMIMLDTTIVNVAVPTLMKDLDADVTAVGWVNSAYLLTFAVLLLVTGRMGDKFGPRPVFIAGLVIFTLASLWCGLSGTVELLIVARAVQGVGGALMTPQTMSMITRVFPPQKRGAAMGLWGAVAGVATITGPVLGGILVPIGWEWIFYVNIPVGVVALVFALRNLPKLPTANRSFDGLGVALSVVGMFLFVFGLQEGSTYDWGTIRGPITVWGVIAAGLLVLVAFVLWQRHRGDDALMPLRLFHSRNFSLSNVAGAAVTFAMTGIFFPFTIFLQVALGMTPLQSALVGLGGSLLSGVVAPFAGRASDRVPGKWIVALGFAILVGVVWMLSVLATPDVEVWKLVVTMCFFGIGTGCLFSPLANLATSGLDHRNAGAGAGAFNTNRQIGGVIGSAAIVAILTSRLGIEIPNAAQDAATQLPEQARQPFLDAFAHVDQGALAGGGAGGFPTPEGVPADVAAQIQQAALDAVHTGLSTAVSQTLLLTVAVLAIGLVSALAMKGVKPHHQGAPTPEQAAAAVGH
ncbi:DHA2 family efflux MFS transporter permease subunit [Cellulomonas sp.]|uniref:DHA2 family efflux MFS transporter permease subunit n=1 Tax=Cellulomonas sp. TaxID=40001 RepID=UPI001B1C8329|nr:DHA2 family efflux MFS transporter permease subunit [Cellulomonas sp.]MBO9553325.1 DHA2 family efflux MFS transporter permease subunit [Cellulomonas sp.]